MCQRFGTAVALDMLQYSAHERKGGFASWTLKVKTGVIIAGIHLSPTTAEGDLSNVLDVCPGFTCSGLQVQHHCGFRDKPPRAAWTFCGPLHMSLILLYKSQLPL